MKESAFLMRTVLAVFCLCPMLAAQPPPPQADFMANPTEGCEPLGVLFTDQSSGQNDIEGWRWDFGDGTFAIVQNPPIHTYQSAGTYEVTLTIYFCLGDVCDPDSSSKSDNITVWPTPEADFTGPSEGCVFEQACFIDLSSPDVTSWSWDFGDGGTSTLKNPCHTYQAPGTYTVTLTVNNAFGCGPDTETATILVKPVPNAAFTGPGEVCVNQQACFTDQSTGNPTSWSWSFGDGGTSGAPSPCHTYTQPGTYTVTLTVSNDCGSDTETSSITVKPVPDAAFTGPEDVCVAQQVCFTDQSTGNPTSHSWDFGDGSAPQQSPCHTYSQVGTYTVSLTVSNDCGSDTETASIIVRAAPDAAFTGPEDVCVGEQACFSDQSSGNPTSRSWSFGDGGTSEEPNPCHTYSQAGTYTVSLTVTNDCGSDTKNGSITVKESPIAAFAGTPLNGCKPLQVCFTDQSSGSPTSWSWDFGDNTNSSQQSPCHTYQDAGTYTVTLMVTNDCGSDEEIKINYIIVKEAPVAAFTGTPRSGCDPLEVCFTDQSSGNPTSWSWEFGDGAGSSEQNPCHIYEAAGTYTVTLTVSNECGSDKEIKVDYITVGADPVAAFVGVPPNGCAELKVCFTDQSSGNPTSWSWEFGDGGTSSQQNPCHTYEDAGTYAVTLTVSNDCGSDKETKSAYVTVLPTPEAEFTGSPREGCEPLQVCFTDQSSGNPTGWTWDFGDGNTSSQQNPCHTYQQAGTYTVSLTVSNVCGSDTETKTAYITVKPRPAADFTGTPRDGCDPLEVCFTDQSSGDPTSWSWNFGDGHTSTQKNPCHTYQQPGTYTVSLIASNECGSDKETKVNYITVAASPTAAFTGAPRDGCEPSRVCFTDQSTGNPTSWIWDFGDGTTSAQQNPCHIYQEAGTYAVSLMVSNSCGSDTETKPAYITVWPAPDADFTSRVMGGCTPPLEVCFTDQSSGNPTSWFWDFGDGTTSTQQNPCHTYQKVGKYTVALTVTNGCGSDTETKVDEITVGLDPEARFTGIPRYGCRPLLVCFTDESIGNPTSWEWDFGDGHTSTKQNPCHTYQDTGMYAVSLAIANDCGLETQTKSFYITVGTVAAAPLLESPIGGEIVSMPIMLCWGDPGDAFKYWIQFDNDRNFSPPLDYEEDGISSFCQMIHNLEADGMYYWRVRSWNTCGWGEWSTIDSCHALGTGVVELESLEPPTAYTLAQNYPNPFNPGTEIRFAVPHDGPVLLIVYDVLGREIVRLINGEHLSPGNKSVFWNGLDSRGSSVPSGIYFYRLTAGDFVQTKKMVLLK